jgi:hypothetical protein
VSIAIGSFAYVAKMFLNIALGAFREKLGGLETPLRRITSHTFFKVSYVAFYVTTVP